MKYGMWYISTRFEQERGCIIGSSMASDLEAFNHNPRHGSFAAVSVQTTALPIM